MTKIPRLVKSVLLGALALLLLIVSSYVGVLAYSWSHSPIEEAKRRLRENIRSPNGPDEIYALLTEGTWGGVGQRYLLVFKDRTVFHCDDGNGRTRERELTKDELTKLRDWISKNKVDQIADIR